MIYLNNEEEQANIAYFDDVSIEHNHSAVIQEESYYPFGMSQHYSYQRELSKKQRYTYNGKESITDLDLGWLDFGARMYQADLGRWFNLDPMAEKYHDMTPYKYGLNNPVAYTDPNGMTEVYGVEMDLGATGSVQNVFDASPDVMEGKNRYESYDDWVEQVGKDYVAELQAKLSNSDDRLGQLNGEVKPDPLKKYLDQSVSLDEFIFAIKGKTYSEIINQLKDRSKTSASSQPGGPTIRYVRNPYDGNVIDMRHMLIVGYQYGETLGNLLEIAQWMRGLPSGMDPQDFYSNRLGAEFMKRWTLNTMIWPSKFSDYLESFFSEPKDYNNGWGKQK